MTGKTQRGAGRMANRDEMLFFVMMPAFDNLCADLLDAADVARERHGVVFPYIAELARSVSHLPGLKDMSAKAFVTAVMSDCPPDGRRLTIRGWQPTVTDFNFQRHTTMQRQVLSFMSWYDSFDPDAAAAFRGGDTTHPFGQSDAFFNDLGHAVTDIAAMGAAVREMASLISQGQHGDDGFNLDVFSNVYHRAIAEVRSSYDHRDVVDLLEAETTVTSSDTDYAIDLSEPEPS